MSLPVKLIANKLKPAMAVETSVQNWKKELANATTSVSDLLKKLNLETQLKLTDRQSAFKCLVTESYINKMQPGNINDPLLRQVLPLNEENHQQIQCTGNSDPVGDSKAMVLPGLLHKYHGRALLISTAACAIHCRYCFRRHFPYQQAGSLNNTLSETLAYLKQHPEIEEIILSGGDPLVLDNAKLEKLIQQLASLRQLKTLRIHSRIPVVLPDRINDGLLSLLQTCRLNIVMVIHVNHANELQQEEYKKLHLLDAAGITLLNQSVLLKGVNDNAEALISLSKRLFDCKTLPYYLHLFDAVTGAMHFDVKQKTALELKAQLEQQLPGYLVPRLVRENAGEQAKTAIFSI